MNDKYKKLIMYLINNEDDFCSKQSWLDKAVEHMRIFWWKYVIYTLTTSIICLFVVSLVLDESITIADMNSWVGIILGLVAMVIGIISMFLSFYNLDQSIKTQEKTLETIEKIKNEIIATVNKNSEKTIDEIHKSSYQAPDYVNMSNKGDWENVRK